MILVTGGTGFLGTEICERLIRDPGNKIYVLVRAGSEENAASRLKACWQHSAELVRSIGMQVCPVTGDFTKPGLDLQADTARTLQETVTCVYHSGAEIAFQKDEEAFVSANVAGTANMLAFAPGIRKLRRFIHISTAYVAGQTHGRIREEATSADSFSTLYEKSKAEAERLVRASGLPYVICRPGMIVGDSRTGRVKSFNTIYYVLKQLLLGKLPLIPTGSDVRLNLVPVDYVADAVCRIGAAEGTDGKIFHLTCPKAMQPAAGELTEHVRKWAKAELQLDIPKPLFIPLNILQKAGLSHNRKTKGRKKDTLSNLLTLLPYFYDDREFDRTNTDAVAGPYDLDWHDYIDKLLEFACRKNFMRQTGDTVFRQAMVRRQSRRYPVTYYDVGADKITAVTGEEANRHILKIRDALWAHGIRKGDRVALTGINSVDYMTLEQAIGLIGAVSVPLYYTTPAAEIDLLLDRSGAKWFFVGDKRIMEKAAGLTADVKIVAFSVADVSANERVMPWETFLAKAVQPAPEQYPDPDDLATIRYTSGTTGEPKGVMFSFAQLAWMGEVMTALLPWTDRNRSMRYLSFLPLSHVVEGILASYAPYYMLAKVDYYYLNDFGSLQDALPKVRPTVFFSVPRFYEKVWDQLMKTGPGQKWTGMEDNAASKLLGRVLRHATLKKAGLDACKQLIVGSAPVSETLLRNYRRIGIEIHNAYGETEAPLITINPKGGNRIPTVGKPLPETTVTAGPDGELFVKGPQVTLGYYGLKSDTVCDGVLKTGDLGSVDADGYVTLHGRKKDMIVTAYGKNISIPKIEGRLKDIPGVSEAVLIGENRPYCTALLWLESGTSAESGDKDTGAKDKMQVQSRQWLEEAIRKMNEELSHPEQIRRFTIIEDPLRIEAGELTPNLKVKRANVEEHLKEKIEAMYR